MRATRHERSLHDAAVASLPLLFALLWGAIRPASAAPKAPSAEELARREIHIELAGDVDTSPDEVCVVSEIARSDSVKPATPTAHGKQTPECADDTPDKAPPQGIDASCLAPCGAWDTSVPLACLRAATVPGIGEAEWTFLASSLKSVAPALRRRGDLAKSITALSSWHESTACSERPRSCAPTFSIPSAIDLATYSGNGTQHERQPLHLSCYPQQGRPLKDPMQVALIFVEMAGSRKREIANGKLVNNLVTLTLGEPIDDRAGLSAAVIGGHYAPTGSAYVVGGHVALSLEPNCSKHAVNLGRIMSSGAKVRASVSPKKGEPRSCEGVTEDGKVALWLTRTEERRGGGVTVEERRAPDPQRAPFQSSEARWDRLAPGETLAGQLRVVSFDWRRGCFATGDVCPEVWVDDVVPCYRVDPAASVCRYVCDATKQNASITLPARLTLSLPSDDAKKAGTKRLEGKTSRYRWHQILPAAGAVLDEDIVEPEGRGLPLGLSWTGPFAQHGLYIDRITLRSSADTIVIDDPGRFSGRVPAPHATCGERFEITYDGSRFVSPASARLLGEPLLIPDPTERLSFVSIQASLLLSQQLSFTTKDTLAGEGTSGRLRVMADFFPLLHKKNVLLRSLVGTVGVSVGTGGQRAQITEAGRTADHIVVWSLVGGEAGMGYSWGAIALHLLGGVGITTIANTGIRGNNADYLTGYSELDYSMRPWRYAGFDIGLGLNFRDPKRLIDLDHGTVKPVHHVVPYFSLGPAFYLP